MDNQEVSKFSVDKRLMKLGGSLVVAVPNEVVEQWNLGKGDEVRISVQEGALRIEPKQSTKIETISEEMVEAYSKAMKGIQAKVTVDAANSVINLEFSGESKEVIDLFVRNLSRNLPVFLRLLGLGSVEELPHSEGKGLGRKKTR
jgi:antitoxin component of MazEF toxin-antitoxin module